MLHDVDDATHLCKVCWNLVLVYAFFVDVDGGTTTAKCTKDGSVNQVCVDIARNDERHFRYVDFNHVRHDFKYLREVGMFKQKFENLKTPKCNA